MRRVIFNQKGGVGKSTISCNLAAISASRGKRTLVVDLDPQGNTSRYLLGGVAEEVQPTLAEFFNEMLSFKFNRREVRDFIHSTPFPKLDLLPAHRDMDFLHDKLGARYKIFKLREALDQLNEYHEIIIDTPPAMNFFTRSALISASSVLIPFDCDDFSRRSLYQLMGDVEEIREDHNPSLRVEGIVVNQYQPRANLPQRLVAELADEGLPLLRSCLSSSVKIRESHDHAQPMVHLFPKHKVTGQFESLWDELNGKAPAVDAVGEAVSRMGTTELV